MATVTAELVEVALAEVAHGMQTEMWEETVETV